MSHSPKVFMFSMQGIEIDFLEKMPELFRGVTVKTTSQRLAVDTAAMAKGSDAVCAFVNDVLDREVLQLISSYGIGVLLMRCAGYNNVDLDAAKDFGIKVLRVPAYSPWAVAEHAVTLLLALNRHIVRASNRARDHDFTLHGGLIGSDIHGKTVGVLGTGKIGEVFARIMIGFGCNVIAHDLREVDEVKEMGVKYVSMDDLFKLSDIISLHCPLLKSTYHIIDELAVSKMKPGVVIINCSRGALVDSGAVIKGLKDGAIGGLGMDVYENEKALYFADLSDQVLHDENFLQLQGFPNVLITPHLAFCTREALTNIWQTTRSNLDEYMAITSKSGGAVMNGNTFQNEVK